MWRGGIFDTLQWAITKVPHWNQMVSFSNLSAYCTFNSVHLISGLHEARCIQEQLSV